MFMDIVMSKIFMLHVLICICAYSLHVRGRKCELTRKRVTDDNGSRIKWYGTKWYGQNGTDRIIN